MTDPHLGAPVAFDTETVSFDDGSQYACADGVVVSQTRPPDVPFVDPPPEPPPSPPLEPEPEPEPGPEEEADQEPEPDAADAEAG